MKWSACILVSAILTSSVPSLACGPDPRGPDPATHDADPLVRALVVTGDAHRLDERDPAAPVLHLVYPKALGQTRGFKFGAAFDVARDRNLARVRARLARDQTLPVVLTRARPGGKWRVMPVPR
jgi:hypothetical protein